MFETGSWHDRAYGALLGVHAGDALGATVEFSSHAEIRKRYPDGLREIIGGGPFDWPAGHATDDTDLTRAVLLAYLTPATSRRDRAPGADAMAFGRRLSLAGAAITGQTFLRGEGRGLVLDSLSLAVAAVLDERSIVDVLVDVVRTGNDTDTNGAIAGGLLGARDGAAAIPEKWLVTLQFADEFASAVVTLADERSGGTSRP